LRSCRGDGGHRIFTGTLLGNGHFEAEVPTHIKLTRHSGKFVVRVGTGWN
jgi:hypothetical protein